MKKLPFSRNTYIVVAVILIGLATISLVRVIQNNEPERIVTTVSEGEIVSIVSVSGVVKAKSSAELAFPMSGRVESIQVTEGDEVTPGQVLVTLEQSALQAEKRDAYAALLIAQADRDELISGPQSEERDVTNTTISIAKSNLARTILEEEEKVENAHRTLFSSSLEALPDKKDNADTPPTISGTYTCEEEGVYKLAVFRSNTHSGYSYRLSGLEDGTYVAYAESPAPLGSCGLSIQFISGEVYGNSDWTISVPNKRSAVYGSNLNAYELALQQKANSVGEKEQALDLALREQTFKNASPRDEALQRANAKVMQAEARLAVIDANIADRTLRAPFNGIINNIDAVKGETVSTAPLVTVVSDNIFELTARIPEIDIAKIAIGQQTDIVFDARSDEVVTSSIAFISPLAIEIDGVAYFEAKIQFENPPPWLRGGLNADVDIIVDRKESALRIPKRFLISADDGSHSVLVPKGNDTATTAVDIGFVGNDGFIEIIGLNAGDTVIAP